MNETQILTKKSVSAEVVQANVDFFKGIAHKYDLYESCRFDSFFQQMLIDDLDRITASVEHAVTHPKALDCGGGTGNIALKLLERGWLVTVVDASPDMLAVLSQKCQARGVSCRIVNKSIETYLADTSDSYDLICFGAVLHHLRSYLGVVSMAADRVRPGGFFYSNFDPVIPKRPFLTDAVTSIDTLAAKILHDPADVFPGILRRVRKLVLKPSPLHQRSVASLGDVADYHARTGVDDCQIRDILSQKGFAVLEHTRYGSGRTLPIRYLNDFCRFSESWKIWARRCPSEL
jgi:2-polyprenyl-3-methyl-5-hydroxy-6-metoxy-1,4-benzoquinol methylase